MIVDLVLAFNGSALLSLATAAFVYTRTYPKVRVDPDVKKEFYPVRTRASWLPFRRRIVQVKLFNREYVSVDEKEFFRRFRKKYLLVNDCSFTNYLSLHWEAYGGIAVFLFPILYNLIGEI